MTLGHLDIIHYGHTLTFVFIGLIATLSISAQLLTTEIISKITSNHAQ